MRREAYDWPADDDIRRRSFGRIIDAEFKVVSMRPVRRWPTIGFPTCLVLTIIAAIVALRFCWPALLMAAVMLGIKTPGEMLGLSVGMVILGAATLRARLNGGRF
jgi:hypothetical protein